MMPRGREPESETPLSNAERQARYRARHKEEQSSVIVRTRRPVGRRSRIQRWRDATGELVDIQAECAAWLDALPESLRGTATAEALQAIVDLDLDALAANEPPRGYGRD
jgi:hypothetical protein